MIQLKKLLSWVTTINYSITQVTQGLNNKHSIIKQVKQRIFFLFSATTQNNQLQTVTESDKDSKYKDWVFINYTYKRFEGLTQRGKQPFPKSS